MFAAIVAANAGIGIFAARMKAKNADGESAVNVVAACVCSLVEDIWCWIEGKNPDIVRIVNDKRSDIEPILEKISEVSLTSTSGVLRCVF